MARIEAAWNREGLRPRTTKTGRMQLDEDACVACGDPLMEDYAEHSTLVKMLGTDVALLRSASVLPIHAGFKLLETCRVGSRKQPGLSGGNVQNLSRGNKKRCPTCGGAHGKEAA
jgi:hypothetical protein